MNLAIVFDDLIQFGGAERLLLGVHEMWPDAFIYTSLASEKWIQVCNRKNIRLRTSFMQELPQKEKLNRFYSVLGLHMLAFESFDFSEFDVVISISSRYAHGVITRPYTKHICYMNSPGRMFWESEPYFSRESRHIRILRTLLSPFLSHTRQWDFTAAKRVDFFVANSEIVQKRIQKYYGRGSKIIYPFVEIPDFIWGRDFSSSQDYFLVLTRLVPWKRVDLAIEAAKNLNLKLKIVGDGPSRQGLENLSKGYHKINFLGYVTEKRKWDLLSRCKALIMTQKEDFGITALEAMAAGRPVIAFKEGGARETIIPGKTGKFFDSQTVRALTEALENFDSANYSPQLCRRQAEKFSKDFFQQELRKFVNEVY